MSDLLEIATPGEWFDLIYGRCTQGWISLFSVDRSTGDRHVDWAPVVERQMAADAAEARSATCDVWFGVATRKDRLGGKRGGGSDCLELPALYADLDVAGPNHKCNDALPRTIAVAKNLLADLDVPATAVVYTGGGIQPYWLLDEPLSAAEARRVLVRWGHTWGTLAGARGLHVDDVFDLARVLRVPGTQNRKHDPVDVHARARAERRYPIGTIDAHLSDPPPRAAPGSNGKGPYSGEARPGDAFNATHGGGDVLASRGFVAGRDDQSGDQHWRWPEAESDTSATVYADDGHTTIWSETVRKKFSAVETMRPYDSFGLYTVLFCDGDFNRATQELLDQGYGKRHVYDLSWLRLRKNTTSETAEEEWPTLDPVALHGIAGSVVQTLIDHTEADPAGLLLVFLAFFGSAAGSAPHAFADGSPHPARLNVALIGDTSRSRKGTTSAQIRRVFEHADPVWCRERIMSGFGSGEALVDEVRDPKMGTDKQGQPVVVDEGVADKRLLVLEGEFARILAVAAREGSTLSAIIRDAWDLGRLAARARSQKSVATGAHVNFVVNITVEELRRRLTDVEVANGLANRYLFACVRRSKLLPNGGTLDEADLVALGWRVREKLEAARKISRVRRTGVAEKRWAEMYAEMAKGPGGLLGATTARAEAQTLRLSVAYALLDGSAEIKEEHLEAAYAVWRFCEDSARHIFGGTLGDDVADRLLEVIRAAGDAGLDFSAQSEAFGRHVKAARLQVARAELEKLGLIRTEKVETDGRARNVSYATAKEAKQAKEGVG